MKQIVPSIIWLVSISIWLLLVLWTGLVRTAAGSAEYLRCVLRRRQPPASRRPSRPADAAVDLGRECRE